MRGSVANQSNQIWQHVDGIGKSKIEARNNSNLVGQNGHKVSDLVHSFRSKDEFINRAKELGTYARENFNIKDMQSIKNEVISSYINDKIEQGLNYRSISTYVSQLEKIQVGLEKMNQAEMKRLTPEYINSHPKVASHQNLFNRQSLINARKIAKEQAVRPKHTNRAYSNLNEIKSNISPENKIAYELQQKHGLRVAETTLIREKQLNPDQILTIQGKGGYTRNISLSKELYQKIETHIRENGSYKVPYNDYRNDLKQAIEKTGQTFNGTHGLRYSYAQKQLGEYLKQGYSKDEALTKISYELGHHRIEITYHYIRH